MTGPRAARDADRHWIPALAYFVVVFVVGFTLGTLRVLLVVPVLGQRYAELLEMPLMIGASFLAARWIVRRFRIPASAGRRLPVGLIALALLIAAELSIALPTRGIGLMEYVASRDPVAGSAYLFALGAFALMPWFVRES